NVYSVDVATNAIKRITAQDGVWDDVQVSPDGRRIALEGYPATHASYQAEEVYVMNTDGSGAQKLTSIDRDPGGIQWARDGSGVFFTVFETGTSNVYFAPASGSGASKLTTGAQMVALTSLSRGGVGAGTRATASDPTDVVRLDLSKRGA